MFEDVLTTDDFNDLKVEAHPYKLTQIPQTGRIIVLCAVDDNLVILTASGRSVAHYQDG